MPVCQYYILLVSLAAKYRFVSESTCVIVVGESPCVIVSLNLCLHVGC